MKKLLITDNKDKSYINLSVSEDGENFSFVKGYSYKEKHLHINFVNEIKNYYFKGYELVFSKKPLENRIADQGNNNNGFEYPWI